MSTNDFQKLRECPFCGGEAEGHKYTSFGMEPYFVIMCRCGARINKSSDGEKAIEAWNTRHERTCELIKHAARDEESGIELVLYECGQCGWIVDPSRNERYCPNCGARVKEDTDEK